MTLQEKTMKKTMLALATLAVGLSALLIGTAADATVCSVYTPKWCPPPTVTTTTTTTVKPTTTVPATTSTTTTSTVPEATTTTTSSTVPATTVAPPTTAAPSFPAEIGEALSITAEQGDPPADPAPIKITG